MGNTFYRQFDIESNPNVEIYNHLNRLEDNTKDITNILTKLCNKIDKLTETLDNSKSKNKKLDFPSKDELIIEAMKKRIIKQMTTENDFNIDSEKFILNDNEIQLLKNNPGLKMLLVEKKYEIKNDCIIISHEIKSLDKE